MVVSSFSGYIQYKRTKNIYTRAKSSKIVCVDLPGCCHNKAGAAAHSLSADLCSVSIRAPPPRARLAVANLHTAKGQDTLHLTLNRLLPHVLVFLSSRRCDCVRPAMTTGPEGILEALCPLAAPVGTPKGF